MIRFACPRCKAVHERAGTEAGAKLVCSCGQKLQVPAPAINQTILGEVQRAPDPQQQIKAGPAAAAPVPVEPIAERDRPDRADDWDDAPRRPRRPAWDDDGGVARYSRSGRPVDDEDCARSATIGFFCALVSVSLIFVGFLMWMLLIAERPGPGRADPFIFLVLALGLVSFVLGLIGVVFSSRGLDPINQRNRGLAIAGLICGILGMVLGLIGSAFFFCIGMFIMALPWR